MMPRQKTPSPKSCFLHIRVTLEEHARVAAAALAAGTGVASYARTLILKGSPKRRRAHASPSHTVLAIPAAHLPEWMYHGQHLNLIAHALNGQKDQLPPGYLPGVVAALSRLAARDLVKPVNRYALNRTTRIHISRIGANLTQIRRHGARLGLPPDPTSEALRTTLLDLINGEIRRP